MSFEELKRVTEPLALEAQTITHEIEEIEQKCDDLRVKIDNKEKRLTRLRAKTKTSVSVVQDTDTTRIMWLRQWNYLHWVIFVLLIVLFFITFNTIQNPASKNKSPFM